MRRVGSRKTAFCTAVALGVVGMLLLAERAVALNQVANWGFETSPALSNGWTAAGTISGNMTETFNDSTAQHQGTTGTRAFQASWTTTSNNRLVTNRTATSTAYVPAASGPAVVSLYYMTSATAAGASALAFTATLKQGATTVATLVNALAVNANRAWTAATATVTLTAGASYTVELLWNGSVVSGATLNTFVDNVTLQVAPAGVSATPVAGTTSAQLAWTASTAGASAGPGLRVANPYQVYRGTSAGGESSLAASATNAYTDGSTAGNTTYWYQVTNFDTAAVESPKSAELSVLTLPGAASAPAATVNGANQITVTWPAYASGTGTITGYRVYRSDSGGAFTLLPGLQTSPFVDGSVAPSTSYAFKVAAVNASGDGIQSSASATVTTPAGIPGTPSAPTASASLSAVQVSVAWSVTANAATYKVWRSTDGSSFGASPVATGVATTSWTDSGATANTTYFYKVQGTSASGTDGPLSPASSPAALTIASAPSAPTATAAAYNKVTVTWPAYAGGGNGTITGYRLYRSDAGGAFNLLAVASPASPYDDTTVVASTSYAYKVAAVNATGIGLQSAASGTVTTPVALPGTPGTPSAVASTTAIQATVTWTAASGATSYKVWRSTDGATFGASPVATGVSSPWTDSSAAANTTYFYKVQGTNTGGDGPLSAASSPAALTIPSAPSAPTAAVAAYNRITVTWPAYAGGGNGTITGYRLYRSDGGGAFNLLAVASPTSPYDDTTVVASTSYAYKVAAVNATGIGLQSTASGTVTTPAALPGAPGTPSATASTAAIQTTVTWTAASGATTYKVWRSSDGSSFGASPVATGVTSPWTDSSAAANTTYFYEVQGTNVGGDGPLSAASAPAALTIASAPSAPTATAAAYNRVTVTWPAYAGGGNGTITGYRLYRSDAGGAFNLLAVASPASPYDDTTVAASTSYAYKVAAVNATAIGLASAASGTVTTPAGPPGTPGTPTAVASTSFVRTTVTWTAAAGATTYKVWRSSDGASFGASPISTGVTSPWTDTTAAANTTWFYKVQGTNASGDGALSAASSPAALTIPSAPTAPTGTAAAYNRITVTWPAYAGGNGTVTGYRLYRSDAGGPFALLPGAVTSPFDDTTVVASTTYAYEVAAVNATGIGLPSAASPSVTTPAGPPGTPGTPVATPSTSAVQVSVAWTAAPGATSYKVYRSTDGVGDGSVVTTNVSSPFTDTTATGLAANTTYYYKVQATNLQGDGAISARSAVALTVPAAPSAPSLSGVTSDKITVSWSAPGGGNGAITGYQLFRSQNGGGFTLVPGSPASPFDDTPLLGSTNYAYRVAAVNATGAGPQSADSATVTTLPPLPGVPGAITFTNVGASSLSVWWGAAANATGHTLQRAFDSAGSPGPFADVATDLDVYYDDFGLSANTVFWYRVRGTNAAGDGPYGAPVSVTTTPAPQLLVGNGSDTVPAPLPAVCPVANPAAVVLDDFTLDATLAADTVTKVTVTLQPAGAYANLAKLEVTSADGANVLGTAIPGANAVVVTLSSALPVAVGSGLHYKVRVTPKTPGAMPSPADGRSPGITATVTAVESTNAKVYGDTAGTVVFTVDNQSPANTRFATVTPGASSISLAWTAPAAPDHVLVLRRAGGPVTDAPTEGIAATSGAIGASQIVYEGTGAGTPDAPPSSTVAYYYKAFVRDACNNWSTGAQVGPVYLTGGLMAEGDPNPGSTGPVVSIENPAKGTTLSGPFRVQVRAFSAATPLTGVQLNYNDGTGWRGTWIDLQRNASYADANTANLGIFEPSPARLTLSPGAYTLVARASNDGGATWINSAAVAVTVNAAGKGDGNLLVRDNSNQLCTDCHAIKPHSAEAAGAKHGSWTTTCRDCHQPHGSKNAYLISNEITPPAVAGVQPPHAVFLADPTKGYVAASPGTNPADAAIAGYANADRTGVCQACHTRTVDAAANPIFRNQGGAPSAVETSHDGGNPCTKCHTHVAGFKGFTRSCTTCHGQKGRTEYEASTPPVDTCGNTSANPADLNNRVGAHAAHMLGNGLTQGGIACDQCHVNPPGREFHDGNPPSCSPSPTDRALMTWGALASGGDGWTGAAIAPTYNYALQTCTTYCHGNFRNGNAAQPTWNGTAPCGSCHGLPPPAPHVQNDACGTSNCHGAGYSKTSASSGTVNAATHADGHLEQSASTCTSCHGTSGRTLLSGTVGTADANLAAAPPTDTTGSSMSNVVGPHLAHVRPDPGQAEKQILLPIACAECHTNAVAGYGMNHASGLPRDVSFADATRATLKSVPASWSPGNPSTCVTYCHGATFTAAQKGSTTTWAWNGTTVTCGSCHGAPPADPFHASVGAGATACNPCHSGTVSASGAIVLSGSTTQHIDGTVQIANVTCTSCHGTNGANAAPPKGVHGETLTTTLAVGAHQSHVLDGGVRNALACTECHPDVVSMTHANGGVSETTFGSSLSAGTFWNRGGSPPTCTTSYCHGAAASEAGWGGAQPVPQWTKVDGTFRACNACHGSPPPLSAATHHPANPACEKCHGPGYLTSGLTGAALDTHVNKTVEKSRSGCTLCHGDLTADGVAASDARVAPGANANAADGTGSTSATSRGVGAHGKHVVPTLSAVIACSECHGILPVDGDVAHATGPNATLSWGTLARSGSSSPTAVQPAGFPAGNVTCSSNWCHGGNTALKGGTNTVNVGWNSGATMNCTSCHGNPPPAPHVQNDSCGTTNCHRTGYSKTTATTGTVNAALHVNGTIDEYSSGSCTACHGNAALSPIATGADANVRAAPPADTTGASATTSVKVGSHLDHVNTASSKPVACSECHLNEIPVAPNWLHGNGSTTINGNFGTIAKTGGVSPTYSTVAFTCSATYCHGNFVGGVGAANVSPAFTSTTKLLCTACHAAPPPVAGAHHPQNPTCASCHPATTYTAASQTGTVGEPAKHVDGVKDHKQPDGCGACHGDLSQTVALANTSPLAAPGYNGLATAVDSKGNSATTFAGVGAHRAHLAPRWMSAAIACAQCHQTINAGDVLHADGVMSVPFPAGTLARTIITGDVTQANPAYPTSGGTCNSTYCHGWFDGGSKVNPGWTGTFTGTGMDCTSCHGNPPPAPHVQNDTCASASCHSTGYAKTGPTTGTVNLSEHVNGVINQTSTTCWSCHGNGSLSPIVAGADANVKAAPPADTTGASATTSVKVGSHLDHVNTATSKPVACTECHLSEVPIATNLLHGNGSTTINGNFGTVAKTGGVTPTYSTGAYTCSATYCHGNFVGGTNPAATPAFTSTTKLLCTACHLDPPPVAGAHHPQNPTCSSCHTGTTYTAASQTGTVGEPAKHVDGVKDHKQPDGCGACHGDLSQTVALGNTSPLAAPGYNGLATAVDSKGNSATTVAGVGAHRAHLSPRWMQSPIACAQCHQTVNAGDVLHADGVMSVPFPTGTLARTIISGDVTQANPAYATSGGTCNATYCHGWFDGGSKVNPGWTGTFTGTGMDCTSCHGNPPPAPHVQNNTCASSTCHTAGYTRTGPTTGTVDLALHLNGVINHSSTTCSSCHGNGTRTLVAGTTGTADTHLTSSPPVDTTGATTGVIVGPHDAHVKPAVSVATGQTFLPIPCRECHGAGVDTYTMTHPDGSTNNATFANATTSKLNGVAAAWNDGSPGTCVTYCHGAAFVAASKGSITTWSWNTGITGGCASCHGMPPDPTGTHQGVGTTAAACNGCHSDTVDATGKIAYASGATKHLDGTLQVQSSCTGCHKDNKGAIPRAKIVAGAAGAEGDDFIRASRHVSNGTLTSIVKEVDCIVCHAEGNAVTSTNLQPKTSATFHAGTSTTVDLRNVDAPSKCSSDPPDPTCYACPAGTTCVVPGGSVISAWKWPGQRKGTPTITAADRNNMDSFCMGCHDQNGASGIAVRTGDAALDVAATPTTTPVARALTPFNSLDNRQNFNESTNTLLKNWRTANFTRVLNVKDQFNSGNAATTGWASHHNLNQFTKRYNTPNPTAWPTAAWSANTTQDGAALSETAGLHCSDCHLNESNAHGSRKTWYGLRSTDSNDKEGNAAFTGMTTTTSTDVCSRCHTPTLYAIGAVSTNSRTKGHGDSRCNNWKNAGAAGLGFDGVATIGQLQCLTCHGGEGPGVIHGTNGTYFPGQGTASAKKYRFMGTGGSMRFYSPNNTATVVDPTGWQGATGSVGCYTISAADAFGSCTTHKSGFGSNTVNRGRNLSY